MSESDAVLDVYLPPVFESLTLPPDNFSKAPFNPVSAGYLPFSESNLLL